MSPKPTIIKNTGRKRRPEKQWIPRITDFIMADRNRPLPAPAPASYQVFYEKPDGFYGIADEEQLNLLRQNIGYPLAIFGTAGSGKTGVGLQRLENYALANLSTCYFTPHARLSRHMRGILDHRLPAIAKPFVNCFAWEEFLARLSAFEAFQPLALCPKPGQTHVSRLHFQRWLDELKTPDKHKAKSLSALKTKYPAYLMYQDYVHVFLSPDWQNPEKCAIPLDAYQALPEYRSKIDKSDRSALYGLFERFIAYVQSQDLYEPRLIAHRLYQALHQPGRPEDLPYLTEALCIDELHMFHPWQWACLLGTLKTPLKAF